MYTSNFTSAISSVRKSRFYDLLSVNLEPPYSPKSSHKTYDRLLYAIERSFNVRTMSLEYARYQYMFVCFFSQEHELFYLPVQRKLFHILTL